MVFMGHLLKTFSVINNSSQLLKSLVEAGECNFYLHNPSLMLSFSLVQTDIDELKKKLTTLNRSLMHVLYGRGLK